MEVYIGQESQLEHMQDTVGLTWLRYDTILSPDNRNMNFKYTCLHDFKKMMIFWSQEKCWRKCA